MPFSCRVRGGSALPILAEDKTVVAEIIYGPQGSAVSVDGNTAAKDAVVVPGGDAVYVLHNGRQTKVSVARSRSR